VRETCDQLAGLKSAFYINWTYLSGNVQPDQKAKKKRSKQWKPVNVRSVAGQLL